MIVISNPYSWAVLTLKGEKSHLSAVAKQAVGRAAAHGEWPYQRRKDSELAEEAGAVAMGRAPWSREEIVIDRRTILSRLAASGIDRRRVRMSGAQQVKVRRQEQFIGVDRISRAAEAFPAKSQDESTESRWQLISQHTELVGKE